MFLSILLIAPLHDVITDPSTGKQYIVLNTTTLNHTVNEDICSNHGGHLPEPKNPQENMFLNNLGSAMFPLGIRRVEGQWRYDNDGSHVRWMSWASWSHHPPLPRGDNCVAITKVSDQETKSLVCQKYNKGK